ncbi:PLP-dependent aminotransferase family protein [Acidisoma sp. S159]|uniref:aminotransferase-like domain-containing protein n=1 Tax=Acidisoma sp. S159 TaxID=1747225 RepID=UPI00131E8C7C|nr:PLP-dependent aminotransferase family protein [Acidisoma sp. S159]
MRGYVRGAQAIRIQLPDVPGALHERLAVAVEQLISERRYQPGDRLPTHRELARQAGVAIGTVTKALELLNGRGILRGEVGRGTFVNDIRIVPGNSGTIDLAVNGPPQVIPEEKFREAAERAMHRSLALPHGGYAAQRGTAEQRRSFAAWLTRTRLQLDENQMIATVGVQHGIYLAFQDLRATSRHIATEGATYPGAIAAAKALDMEMLPVLHDSGGIDPDDLDRVLGASGAKVIYLTPVCHNPIGFEMSEERRRAVLAIAEKHDARIVEDDIYSVYAAKGGPTFKELAPSRTYYLNSISKCLTPLLRVGIIAPPADRIGSIAKAVGAVVWGASPHGLELACALIEVGADTIVAAILRSEAKARVQLAQRVLALDSVPMPDGAPHLWLPMPVVQAGKLARLSSERGVRLTPPDASFVGGESGGGIRLSVMATTNRDDLEKALRTIAALLIEPDEMII